MEVILMVGIAGVGKTTFVNMIFPKHVRICLDDIPRYNRNQEYALIEGHLKQQQNIVIDDTNLTRDIRAKHIVLAKKYGAKIKACFIDISMEKIQKNNKNREKCIPDSALFRMGKQLQLPQKDEGFNYIQTMHDNFIV